MKLFKHRSLVIVLSVVLPFVVQALFIVVLHTLYHHGYSEYSIPFRVLGASGSPLAVASGFALLAGAIGPRSALISLVYFPIAWHALSIFPYVVVGVLFGETL